MTRGWRIFACVFCVLFAVTGCGWNGVNSLPLPGAPGRGPESKRFLVEMPDVGTLVSNSPVMIDDVVVGSVGDISVRNWHAVVSVSVKPEVTVAANAVAKVGQTSLLGSSHLALDPPLGEAPEGSLEPGATLPLNSSSTYPSTEQTLASLSMVVNGGSLGQLGDIIDDLQTTFDGREGQIRDLLTRLDTFMGVLNRQRGNIVTTIHDLNRLSGTFAEQRDVASDALRRLPEALQVLVDERPKLTTALEKLRVFSNTAAGVVSDTQQDVLTNLHNLEPTLAALADVGPDLNKALAYTTVFPYGQKTIDRAVRGDYINLHAVVDLTVPRLQRELLLGTPLGDPNAVVQAAVGDPGYAEQTDDPLGTGIRPPAPAPEGGR